MAQERNRRKVKNFLLDPLSQLRSAFAIFAVAFIAIALVFGSSIYQVTDIMKTLAAFAPEATGASDVAANARFSLLLTFGLTMLSLLFASVFLATAITHRYLGPMVPIKRYVKELLDGKYDSRLTLRKNDQFQDLADDLNKLAEKLNAKQN